MDLIDKQKAIDKFEPWLKVKGYSEGELNVLKAVLYELRVMPSAQPELDSEALIRTIEMGITATNSNDIYSLGMRNGMRWCKSLIDGVEPKFENYVTSVDDWKELPSAQPYTAEEIDKMQELEAVQMEKAYELGKESAQPEQKKGEWMLGFNNQYLEKYYYCSKCGSRKYEEHKPLDYFCSNCGADMRGSD